MIPTDIHIPAASLEAGARAAYEVWRTKIRLEEIDTMPPDLLDEVAPEWDDLPEGVKQDWIYQHRAALRAGLKAWPGMEIEMVGESDDFLILPLPQEGGDE